MEEMTNARNKRGLSVFFITSNRLFLSTCLNKKTSKIMLMLILKNIDNARLGVTIYSCKPLPISLLYASRYFWVVFLIICSGSGGEGGVLSQFRPSR